MIEAIQWRGDHLALIDQRVLPFRHEHVLCRNVGEVADAIRNMVVRGAPAIGVTAAYGMVLALRDNPEAEAFMAACDRLGAARPTAVNLFDAIAYMNKVVEDCPKGTDVVRHAEEAAKKYHQDDLNMNREIGRHGAEFLAGNRKVLTHCNTGSLATSGWGTALGVVRQLHQEQRLASLFADETRPFLQGARLTVWECRQDGIPVKLVTDGMGGYLMTKGMVDCVVVGSDRIAANGDVANKIGTFMLAMAAKHHGIPFVVAAPSTTVDRNTPNGEAIPIEQRPEQEVLAVGGKAIVEDGTEVMNPAFDVTPSELVTAIVTEEGVFQYPYDFSRKS